jgi:hypothetical protein
MFNQITLHAALVCLAMVGPAIAQDAEKPDVPTPPVIESPQEQIDNSAIKYEISGTMEFRPDSTRSMQVMLSEIVTWLSTNFDLPAIHDYPKVELVPQVKLAALRYRGLATDRERHSAAMPLNDGRDLLAIYDDVRKTIYLPQGWTGTKPAEVSVLVHEMVHHLQNLAGTKYNCPEEREKPAYLAQKRWLDRFGLNLADEFQIDGMTVLVRTNCMN